MAEWRQEIGLCSVADDKMTGGKRGATRDLPAAAKAAGVNDASA